MKTIRSAFPYLMSFVIVALASFLVWMAPIMPSRDLIMFYLLAVVIVAVKWGRGPAIAASLTSVLVFDFFFVPPKFGFAATYVQDWVVLASFLTVGLLISTLMARARASAFKVQALELLREKEKLQSVLLNSVSHDLRTPLSSITATLSNLFYNKSLDKETHDELVETAYGESARLNLVVGNLLDMTRVEAGALKISEQPCDISDLVGATLQQFPKEKTAGRPIRIRVPKDLPEVSMDFTLMSKVLMNIIDNALKYAPAYSPLDIEVKIRPGSLRFEIIDQGPGVPEKDIERIFDKFYCVERPEKIPGTGLGLPICKGIVEAHQGKIWAENGSGGGLKIIITLPLICENELVSAYG